MNNESIKLNPTESYSESVKEDITLRACEMAEFQNAILEAPNKKRAIISVAHLLPTCFPEHFPEKTNEELQFRRETAQDIVDLLDEKK